MAVIGISCFYHDSAASLISNEGNIGCCSKKGLAELNMIQIFLLTHWITA